MIGVGDQVIVSTAFSTMNGQLGRVAETAERRAADVGVMFKGDRRGPYWFDSAELTKVEDP